MTDLVKSFVDIGGAAIRAQHVELDLSAAIASNALSAEFSLLLTRFACAIEKRDVLITRLDVVIGA